MSFVKREMERQMQMDGVATSIAIEMSALERCDICEEVRDPLAGMDDDVLDEALTRFRSSADEMEPFQSEEEVRKAVENAFRNAGEECSCGRHRDD